MKKFIIAVITGTLLISCTNPSMERGLESLNASLAELEAEIVAADINGMLADLEEMQDQVGQMTIDVEEYNATIEQALLDLQDISTRLNAIVELSEDWATSEQMQSLLVDVQTLGEGIDMLVFIADYDYDGVMNGLDQCPDTPLDEINEVNGVGCSPSQLAG